MVYVVRTQVFLTATAVFFNILIISFQFGKILKYVGLHQAFLNRPITLFIPTNDAMKKYKGVKDENLALNHMANVAILAHQLDESLVSLVTGSPPLWVNLHYLL